MTDDPVCRICGSRKSEHVSTSAGLYTHPREAHGEGKYVLRARGTSSSFDAGMQAYEWERWEFVPNSSEPEASDG